MIKSVGQVSPLGSLTLPPAADLVQPVSSAACAHVVGIPHGVPPCRLSESLASLLCFSSERESRRVEAVSGHSGLESDVLSVSCLALLVFFGVSLMFSSDTFGSRFFFHFFWNHSFPRSKI